MPATNAPQRRPRKPEEAVEAEAAEDKVHHRRKRQSKAIHRRKASEVDRFGSGKAPRRKLLRKRVRVIEAPEVRGHRKRRRPVEESSEESDESEESRTDTEDESGPWDPYEETGTAVTEVADTGEAEPIVNPKPTVNDTETLGSSGETSMQCDLSAT